MTDKPIIQADFVKPQPVPSRKVLQLVFEVPEEAADHAMAILGGFPQSGKNRWCAIARLTDQDAVDDAAKPAQEETPPPAEQTPAEPGRPMATETKRKMVQRAALVCKEEAFQQWIARGFTAMWHHKQHCDKTPEERAAYYIYIMCGISSRSNLDPDGNSGASFREIMGKYRAAMEGRTTADLETMRDGR